MHIFSAPSSHMRFSATYSAFRGTSKPIARKHLKIFSSAENHGKVRRVADRWAHFENTHLHFCFGFPWVVLNVTVDWDPCWFLRPDSKVGEENGKNPTYVSKYRLGMVNSNMVNSKFHLIRSFFEIFARFLSFHV